MPVGLAGTAPIEGFFRSITTTEGRLAVSGVIILLALVVAALIAPRAVRWASRRIRRWMADRGGWEYLRQTGTNIPASVTRLLVRVLQVGTIAVAGTALLVVWGRFAWALTIFQHFGESSALIRDLAMTVVIVLVAYVALEMLSDAIDRFGDEIDRVTDHQQEIVRRLGQLGIIALAIATGLTLWGINLSGLLVGAGFLGIVVGLAARQTLGSLIAGLVLMFSKPFTIGDWVVIGGQEGIVTDITIVNTRLENFDGEFLIIPNDRVANEAITNRSRKGHHRIRVDVGVDYDTDPEHAQAVAIEAINGVDHVEPAPPPQAVRKEFGDSAVVIELRFWIDRPTPPRMWQAIDGVVEAVHNAFEAEGIKIPFPQREVTGRAETGGVRVRTDDAVPEGTTRGTNPDGDTSGDGG